MIDETLFTRWYNATANQLVKIVSAIQSQPRTYMHMVTDLTI